MTISIVSKPTGLFREQCSKCGTEFTYELSDVKSYGGSFVYCPTCGDRVFHRDQRKRPSPCRQEP